MHPGVQRRVSLQPPEMVDLKVLVVSPKRNVSILFTVEFPNLVPEFHDSLQLIVFSSHLTEPGGFGPIVASTDGLQNRLR